ncbi:hypothetical protein TRFO_32315 [Tritrichomonas foetus]|uniref:Transmembrane protein n=1 Tax=Tritrichomonas foetus TaxID=1144522 RepID=A0A1J4JP38_9EUKA|nr:hypothetical protein TRFO_32315 [Tritrichomonas foetus]|eukprot:OHT00889.1 hypothetical protein TRFO_32315 [Tritrichomonas foetus]
MDRYEMKDSQKPKIIGNKDDIWQEEEDPYQYSELYYQKRKKRNITRIIKIQDVIDQDYVSISSIRKDHSYVSYKQHGVSTSADKTNSSPNRTYDEFDYHLNPKYQFKHSDEKIHRNSKIDDLNRTRYCSQSEISRPKDYCMESMNSHQIPQAVSNHNNFVTNPNLNCSLDDVENIRQYTNQTQSNTLEDMNLFTIFISIVSTFLLAILYLFTTLFGLIFFNPVSFYLIVILLSFYLSLYISRALFADSFRQSIVDFCDTLYFKIDAFLFKHLVQKMHM